jgi:hypothetical protein
VVAVLASSVRGGVESGRGGVGPCCTRLPACLCGKRGLGRAQGAAAGATHALRSPQLPRLAPPSHPHTARRTACTMWWTAAATPSTPPRRTGGERRRGDACKQQRALLGAPLHSHCVGGSWPALLQFPGGGGGGGRRHKGSCAAPGGVVPAAPVRCPPRLPHPPPALRRCCSKTRMMPLEELHRLDRAYLQRDRLAVRISIRVATPPPAAAAPPSHAPGAAA